MSLMSPLWVNVLLPKRMAMTCTQQFVRLCKGDVLLLRCIKREIPVQTVKGWLLEVETVQMSVP